MSAPVTNPAPGKPVTLDSLSRRRDRRAKGGNPLVYAVALIVVIATLGPVVYTVLGGFRSNAQLASAPVALPEPWVVSNYVNVLSSEAFWRFALNSTIVALVTTVITAVFGVMAACPLARYQFKGRETLTLIFTWGCSSRSPWRSSRCSS